MQIYFAIAFFLATELFNFGKRHSAIFKPDFAASLALDISTPELLFFSTKEKNIFHQFIK